ncbi:hypothetical protein FKG94_23810 [Exilibacterium tricleocarpae]|uniref:Alpha/beta hydrolase n=1 Tax=Exilibacterium tricleocarpae TaxID=2591008 RepID=A0A545ST20_9GAMM|nr:hypothetical protein FKG94_23810 [Exilibacterium tricleocarpae]
MQRENANLVDPDQTTGYDVYITPHAELTMQYLVGSERELDTVKEAIMKLSSLPRSLDSFQRRDGIDIFATRLGLQGKYQIEYGVHSGAVTLYSFALAGAALIAQHKSEKPQLYHIKKTKGAWAIDVNNPPKTQEVKTQHAAVNGQSNDLQKAAWLMAAHLEKRYGEIQEYTLYHNPTHYMLGGKGDTWESFRDKLGITTAVTRKFVDILDRAQEKGDEIKWVAHSQGSVIFAEAVRVYEKRKQRKGSKFPTLDKHSVAFNGCAINIAHNHNRLTRMGVRYTVHNAPDDMVAQIIGLNSVTLLLKGSRGRVVGIEKFKRSVNKRKSVTDGTTTESPHTLPHGGSRDRELKLQHGLQRPSKEIQSTHDASVKKLGEGFFNKPSFFNFRGCRKR